MGAWSVAIFSDDTAADIKGDWQTGLREGKDPASLTQDLVKKYHETFNDVDEGKIFWIALAASQHETGHLETEVRDKALSIIKLGGDVDRWEEESASLARQRKAVLDKLTAKLEGPQPKPKKLKALKPKGVHFDVGDVVQLRNLENGATAIVIIVDHTDGWPKGTVNPVAEILLWEESRLPLTNEIVKLPTLLTMGAFGEAKPHLYSLLTPSKKLAFNEQLGTVIAKGVARRPAGNFKSHDVQASYITWPTLARMIGNTGLAKDIELTKEVTKKSFLQRLFKK